MRRTLFMTGALVLFLALPSHTTPARAAGFTVNSPLDAPDTNPGDGICASAVGVCTLRAAIQEANATLSPDTVTLPPGTYALSIVGRGEDLGATGDLDVTRPLTITGAGAGSTIIDGNAADRIFHIIGPIAVQLSGLTLRNGNVPRPADISADGGGGAIYVVGGGSLTLSNVVVTGNNATSGAIAIDDGGSLVASSATINGNTASFGAGVFNNGSVTILNTTIGGNTASSSGGGIYDRQGSLSIVNSTISGNTASSASIGGGGILVAAAASTTITNSLISGNTASNNGGSIHTRGTVGLVSSTVSGNTAHNGGGGLYAGGGSTTLNNATLNSNSASGQGGGILTAGGSVAARNTIIANSTTGGNCAGQVTSLGYNLDTAQTCALNGPGDLMGVNPQLGPLQNNGGPTMTHALLPLSAAIDAGNPLPPGAGNGACESTDERGQPRPTDGNGDGLARCDIGAFEGAGVSPVPGIIPILAVGPTRVPTASSIAPTPTATVPVPPTPALPALSSRTSPPPTPSRVAAEPLVRVPETPTPEEPTRVLVIETTTAVSVDDDLLDPAEAGDWYVLLVEEDGWLLVASDPDWPFWIVRDERVEVYRP